MSHLSLKVIEVDVPDCISQPQPWWESSGVLPAIVVVSVVLVGALAIVIGMWLDGRQS